MRCGARSFGAEWPLAVFSAQSLDSACGLWLAKPGAPPVSLSAALIEPHVRYIPQSIADHITLIVDEAVQSWHRNFAADHGPQCAPPHSVSGALRHRRHPDASCIPQSATREEVPPSDALVCEREPSTPSFGGNLLTPVKISDSDSSDADSADSLSPPAVLPPVTSTPPGTWTGSPRSAPPPPATIGTTATTAPPASSSGPSSSSRTCAVMIRYEQLIDEASFDPHLLHALYGECNIEELPSRLMVTAPCTKIVRNLSLKFVRAHSWCPSRSPSSCSIGAGTPRSSAGALGMAAAPSRAQEPHAAAEPVSGLTAPAPA